MKVKTMNGKPKFRLSLSERDAVALWESLNAGNANDSARAQRIDGALYEALRAAGVDV